MESLLNINDSIYLSAYDSTDQPLLIRYLNDPEIARNTLTIPYPYTEADAQWWLQRIENTRQEFGALNSWAIRHRTHGLIGGIGVFFHSGPEGHYDEIGYWLGAPFRGAGYMTEVVRAFSRWQFDHRPKLVRLEAWVFAHNPGSMRVLEKAGYAKEGYARQRRLKNGVSQDCVLFGILRTDLL